MSIRLQPIDLRTLGWDKTTRQITRESEGLVDLEKVLTTPLESLTTQEINGKGAFDVLMKATKLHLQEEYNAQRITGPDYAGVYLGAVTAVLQTATQFLLNEQQAHKLNAEIGLVRQQTVSELANTDDSVPEGLGFNFMPGVRTEILPVDCFETPIEFRFSEVDGEGGVADIQTDNIGVEADIGDILYRETDFILYLADATTIATMPAIVMALEAGSGIKQILQQGYVSNVAWNWHSGLIYASKIPGKMTQDPSMLSGEQVQVVGWAKSQTNMWFEPDLVLVEPV